jgi:hypothetical protein
MRRDRGYSNGNDNGNSDDRRARRLWLVSPAAGFGGDGEKVLCQVCRAVYVTVSNMVVGRIVPRTKGGTYRRGNIRPECAPCSCREGQRAATEIRNQKRSQAAAIGSEG